MPGDIWSACIFNAMNNLQNILPLSNFPSVHSLLFKILAISFVSATNLVKLTSLCVLPLFPIPSFFSGRADSSAAIVHRLSAHMFLPSLCITLQLKGSHHKTCMFLYFKFLNFLFYEKHIYLCCSAWCICICMHCKLTNISIISYIL